MRARVSTLLARLGRWWTLEAPEERIEGSGTVYLDPAYNSRYTAERRLNQLATAQAEALEDADREAGPSER